MANWKVCESGYGLNWGNVLVFAWNNWGGKKNGNQF